MGNILVPKSIDSGPRIGLLPALLIDVALLAIFAVQHSVMARPAFKRVWTRIVPWPIERSTYTLLSSAALILLFVAWQPLGGTIWEVTYGPLQFQTPGFYKHVRHPLYVGWLLAFWATSLEMKMTMRMTRTLAMTTGVRDHCGLERIVV